MHVRASLAAYQKAMTLGSRSLSLLRGMGNAHASLKDYRQAATEYRKALEVDGRDLSSLVNLGWMQYQMGEYRESIAASRRAIDVAPDHPAAWYNLALGHLRLGQHDESMGAFEKAFAKDTGRAFVRDVIADLAQAVKDDAGLTWGHFALGLLHMHLAQRPAEAVQAFETFIRQGGSGKWATEARERIRRLAAQR